MRIEILAKRLAQKTNTPALEDFILGRRSLAELPNDCMVWTGKATSSGVYIKQDRDCKNIPVKYRTMRRPLGQIQVEGRTEYTHRLVFKLLTKPTTEFQMRNICGKSLCCNPKHWDVSTDTPQIVIDDSPWTLEEAEEAVEMFLTRYEPKSWDDVVVNPLLQDIPHDMLREILIKNHKEHLT